MTVDSGVDAMRGSSRIGRVTFGMAAAAEAGGTTWVGIAEIDRRAYGQTGGHRGGSRTTMGEPRKGRSYYSRQWSQRLI